MVPDRLLIHIDEGMRHQVFLTDTAHGEGSPQHPEARHRARARVEDRIHCGKVDTPPGGQLPRIC